MSDLTAALDLLDDATDLNDIRDLIRDLDFQIEEGKVGLLYSGAIFEDGGSLPSLSSSDVAFQMELKYPNDLVTINSTDIEKFINSDEMDAALARLGLDPDDVVGGLTAGDGGPSLWAVGSEEFAKGLSGKVITLTAFADAGDVFGAIELQALLDNPYVTHIDGIDVNELKQLSIDEAFDAVTTRSQVNVISNIDFKINDGSYVEVQANPNFFQEAGQDAGKFPPTADIGGEPIRTAIDPTDLDTIKIQKVGTWLDGLKATGKVLGPLGDFLEIGVAAFAIEEAYEAGDIEGVFAIAAEFGLVFGSSTLAAEGAIGAFTTFMGANVSSGGSIGFTLGLITLGGAAGYFADDRVSELVQVYASSNDGVQYIIYQLDQLSRFIVDTDNDYDTSELPENSFLIRPDDEAKWGFAVYGSSQSNDFETVIIFRPFDNGVEKSITFKGTEPEADDLINYLADNVQGFIFNDELRIMAEALGIKPLNTVDKVLLDAIASDPEAVEEMFNGTPGEHTQEAMENAHQKILDKLTPEQQQEYEQNGTLPSDVEQELLEEVTDKDSDIKAETTITANGLTKALVNGDLRVEVYTDANGDEHFNAVIGESAFDIGTLASMFGTTIGKLIGGGDQLTQIVSGTIAGGLADNLAETVAFSFLPLEGGFDNALDQAFSDFGINLATEVVGAASSYMTAQLVAELGLDGFAGGAANAVGNTIIGTAANQYLIQGSTGLDQIMGGLSWDAIGSGFSSFFGGYLANELVSFDTVEGQIGSSLGASLGGYLAMRASLDTALNFVMPGVGTFVGAVLGGLIGDLFSGTAESGVHVIWDDTINDGAGGFRALSDSEQVWVGDNIDVISDYTGFNLTRLLGGDHEFLFSGFSRPVLPGYEGSRLTSSNTLPEGEYQVNWADDGAQIEDARQMAKSVADIFNAVYGVMTNQGAGALINPTIVSGGAWGQHDKDGNQALYRYWSAGENSHKEDDYTIMGRTPEFWQDHYFAKTLNVNEAMGAGVGFNLSNLIFVGGDLMLRRAFYNNLEFFDLNNAGEYGASAILADLTVAAEYKAYLEDPSVVNLLLSTLPSDNAFAVGWGLTFARASELQLDEAHSSDFYGGLQSYLMGQGLDASAFEGLSVSLVDADGDGNADDLTGIGSTITNFTSVMGYNTTGTSMYSDIFLSSSTTSNVVKTDSASAQLPEVAQNIIIGGMSTLSDDIFIAGSGNDTLKGGVGWDWLDGGAGSDSLSGGDGRDVILGRNGDDVADGGNDDDTIFGGAGQDVLYGGRGDDELFGNDYNGTNDSAADTLRGGFGADVYNVSDQDVIIGLSLEDKVYFQGQHLSNLNLVFIDGAPAGGFVDQYGNTYTQSGANIVVQGLDGSTFTVLPDDDLPIETLTPQQQALLDAAGRDGLWQIEAFGGFVADYFSLLASDLEGLSATDAQSFLSDAEAWLDDKITWLTGRLDQTEEWINSGYNIIVPSDFEQFRGQYEALVSSFKQLLTNLSSDFNSNYQPFLDGLSVLFADEKQLSNDFSVYINGITFEYLASAINLDVFAPVDSSVMMSPLVFDLDGDGIETVGKGEVSAFFDLDQDGFAEWTGWIAPDDGFLVYDANGDGKINDISEMFGYGSVSPSPSIKTGGLHSGFQQLGLQHDENADGIIDVNDSIWNSLQVWQDADVDGTTDIGELRSLDELGIQSISLNSTSVNEWDKGNQITDSSQFTWTGGETGEIADVWFAYEPMITKELDVPAAIDPAIQSLPYLNGFGEVSDLDVAMHRDPVLRGMVEDLLTLTVSDINQYWDLVENLILRWHGVNDVALTSRGINVNAQHLEAIEKLQGFQFLQLGKEEDPRPDAGKVMEVNWEDYLGHMSLRLMLQIPLGEALLPSVTSEHGIAQALMDGISVADIVQDIASHAPAVGTFDDIKFWKSITIILSSLSEELGVETTQLASAYEQVGTPYTFLEYKKMLVGSGGHDYLVEQTENDGVYVRGGPGDDTIRGYSGDDIYLFNLGDGSDLITDYENNLLVGSYDTLLFGAGILPADVLISRTGDNLTLSINGTDDSVTIGRYFDNNSGYKLYLIEEISFDDGTIWTRSDVVTMYLDQSSTSGDDLVSGFETSETLEGGLGNDTLHGGGGHDTYVYNLGDGHDVIRDYESNVLVGSNDTLVLGAGIAVSDVGLSREGDDLILNFVSFDGSIKVERYFDNNSGYKLYLIESIVFEDGTSWSRSDVVEMVLSNGATDGNDDISGFETNETLQGGLGDDTLRGGGGHDTYIYNAGDGHDVIYDYESNALVGSYDKLIFGTGITPGDVVVSRSGNNIVLSVNEGSGSVEIRSYLSSKYNVVEEIIFEDGTIWYRADITSQFIENMTTDGDDHILGSDWKDTLEGGVGNDTLVGGDSGDIYHFNLGDGQDYIHDYVSNVWRDGTDKLIFGPDISPEDITISRNSYNAVLSISGTNDSVELYRYFHKTSYYHLEQIVFDDGTVWDTVTTRRKYFESLAKDTSDTIYGFKTNDTLIGGLGDDTLRGDEGTDVYVFNIGDGQDTIRDEGWEGTDTVQISGYLASDAIYERLSVNSNSLVIKFHGSNDTITIINTLDGDKFDQIEKVIFEDGTEVLIGEIRADLTSLSDNGGILYGDSVAESLVGGAGDDLIEGGGGADTISASAGNDTISGNSGSDIVEAGDGDDLVYGTSDGDSLSGGLGFDTLSYETISTGILIDIANSSAGSDTITGFEYIIGSEGGDTLIGSLSNETLQGGSGADIYQYYAGNGAETYIETQLDETYSIEVYGYTLEELVLTEIGADLIISFGMVGDEVTVLDWRDSVGNSRVAIKIGTTDLTSQHVEQFLNGDYVFDASDVISGTTGPDTLNGGPGNDTLHGGDGSDTYVFNPGDGVDHIDDNGYKDTDKLVIHGYSPADVSMARAGANLILSFAGSSDQITLYNTLEGSSYDAVEQIIFDDGTVWLHSYVRQRLIDEMASDGDDVIQGFGGSGDTLTGGLGNDTLHGGDASDTYVFNPGDGIDHIDDNGYKDTDKLVIHGYSPADVSMARAGANLILSFAGSSDQITLYNTLEGSSYDAVEQIIFDDGTVWLHSYVRQRLVDEMASDGDDVIQGFEGSGDTLTGGLGNDTLHGGDASDTYVFNPGDGIDHIDDNGYKDTDKLVIHGYSPADTVFTRLTADSSSLSITFKQSTDSIVVIKTLAGNKYDQVEQVHFDDGTVLLISDILAGLNTGDDGNNIINGSSAAELLNGGDGDDTLDGGSGADTIEGGNGNDLLTGGAGVDQFTFGNSWGADTISDFAAGTDILDFIQVGITYQDLSISQSGADTLIEDAFGNSIVILNLASTALTTDDFLF